jgi:hypothetical protein
MSLLCLDTGRQAEGTHMRNYRRSEFILIRVTRLHVLVVNFSASVAIGTRATSTPRLHVLGVNSSASVAIGTRATSTPRLHVLGVNSSASVAIGTKATSIPRRTCGTRRTVSHDQFPSAVRPHARACALSRWTKIDPRYGKKHCSA